VDRRSGIWRDSGWLALHKEKLSSAVPRFTDRAGWWDRLASLIAAAIVAAAMEHARPWAWVGARRA